MKKVLLCANPDLNIIDGSSIWSQTIALVFAETGDASVDFIAKSPMQRYELFEPLIEHEQINIIDGIKSAGLRDIARLDNSQLALLARDLHRSNHYNVIVLRSFEIATILSGEPSIFKNCWVYLTDMPQKISAFSSEQKRNAVRIAEGCNRLLCQTNEFARLWQQLVPKISMDKLVIYPPVIPDFDPENLTPISQRRPIAVYAGKFKNEWMTLEMANTWPEVSSSVDDAELLMIGDKIHNEAEPIDYQERMRYALTNTNGLTWLGAMPREGVQKQIETSRVGLSWRAESMNDAIEYSTKILEYGGAGCAVILNRNSLHEYLLGEDYPLFANSETEYITRLRQALTDDNLAQQAVSKLVNLALQHRFSERVASVRNLLKNSVEGAANPKSDVMKVLVAGHDLKFFKPLQRKLEETGKFEFMTDLWQGHNRHDPVISSRLLEQADIIFCEWCLGNVQWYSHNKGPDQKLIARFHLQERELPYLKEADWSAIDHISFVSEYIRREGLKAFGFPVEKTSVISNFLDESKFRIGKKVADARYTIGMIGSVPSRKRLDRAIDLLELLLEKNERYCLRVKGKYPLDYPWILNREEELTYYRSLLTRINSNPRLRYKVIFDPPEDDVNNWFTLIGFILSPSEFESFHMAIGEGLLTGTMPIIWNWEGADEIWGKNFVVDNTKVALKNIEAYNENESTPENLRFKVNEMHGSDDIARCWTDLLLSI